MSSIKKVLSFVAANHRTGQVRHDIPVHPMTYQHINTQPTANKPPTTSRHQMNQATLETHGNRNGGTGDHGEWKATVPWIGLSTRQQQPPPTAPVSTVPMFAKPGFPTLFARLASFFLCFVAVFSFWVVPLLCSCVCLCFAFFVRPPIRWWHLPRLTLAVVPVEWGCYSGFFGSQPKVRMAQPQFRAGLAPLVQGAGCCFRSGWQPFLKSLECSPENWNHLEWHAGIGDSNLSPGAVLCRERQRKVSSVLQRTGITWTGTLGLGYVSRSSNLGGSPKSTLRRWSGSRPTQSVQGVAD